jgi:putative FmdB family regulatory protein
LWSEEQTEEFGMPTYEYRCQKCAKRFELVYSLAEYESQKKRRTKCPKCGSVRVARQISAFQVQTSKKS